MLSAVEFVDPGDAGILDVTNLPAAVLAANPGLSNAVADDGIDDTAAIQAALDFQNSGRRIVYLPDGVYDVSSTLTWPGPTAGGLREKETFLQGQSTEGTVIRLIDGTAASAATETAILQTGTTTGPGGTSSAERFGNSVRNVTLNVGQNNPYAVGAEFIANNQGAFRDVKIISEDGQGLIGLSTGFTPNNGPALISNLEVIGFDTGITAASNENSLTFENITLRDQNVTGFDTQQQSVFIRGLFSENDVPALVNSPTTAGANNGTVHLIDAQITGTGNGASSTYAILNVNTADMFLRNIQTEGYLDAFASIDAGSNIVATLAGDDIDEHITSGVDRLFDASPDTSIGLPVIATPKIALDSDLSTWANVESYGAIGGDGIDDTAAFQAAIDDATKTTVYLPSAGEVGAFTIDGTLYVRGTIERIVGFEGLIDGAGNVVFQDGVADTVIWERIDHALSTIGDFVDVNFDIQTSRDVVIASSQLSGGPLGDVDRLTFKDAGGVTVTTLEAETFDASDEIGVFQGGTVIGSIHTNEFARYDAVDFSSGAATVTARVASPVAGSSVELRLGGIDGALTGVIDIPNTGSFTSFVDVTATLTGATGVNDVYAVFRGGHGIRVDDSTTGTVFLEDVVGGPILLEQGTTVYARQINVESPTTNIVNDGGQLWVLGLKTEVDRTVIETKNGGTTEAIGVFPRSGTSSTEPAGEPMFIVDNANLAVSLRELNFSFDPFDTVLVETRGSETRTLTNSGSFGTVSPLLSAYDAANVPTSPYAVPGSTIQAESFDASNGIGAYSAPSGQKIGGTQDGEWVRYDNIDFGRGAVAIEAWASSANAGGGSFEVRLDSLDGELLGTVNVAQTGSWNDFELFTASLGMAFGVHDVYLVAKGSGSSLFDLDFFRFDIADAAIDAIATTEAEDFNGNSETGIFSGGGAVKTGAGQPGAWTLYKDVDFGAGVTTFNARVGSGDSTSALEVRTGSPTGTLAGTLAVGNTGGFNTYVDLSTSVTGLSGTHDLYLVQTGSGIQPGLVDADSFFFSGSLGVAPIDATVTFGAEDFDEASGIDVFESGTVVGAMQNGDYIAFLDRDFGLGATQLEVRYAGPTTINAALELRLGSPTGTLVDTVSLLSTGSGFTNYRTQIFDIGSISGTQDLYLVATGGGAGSLFDIDSFRFIDAANEVGRSAFDPIEAELFSDIDPGVGVFNNGQALGSIQNGELAVYTNLDFGTGASQFQVRYAAPGSLDIEIRDNATGTLLDTVTLAGTGGFGSFQDGSFEISTIAGVRDIRLVFSGAVDFDRFQFGKSAFNTVQAESFTDADPGVGIFGGGTVIGGINDGEYVGYANLGFGAGATQIEVTYAGPTNSQLELRLGGSDGTLIDTISLLATGSGFSTFRTQVFDISTIAGVHDLYFVARSSAVGSLFDIDSFRFIDADNEVGRSAFIQIEAELFSDIDPGIGAFSGGTVLGGINSSEYAGYTNLDFGTGATQIELRYASLVNSTIEIRLGSPAGTLVDSVSLSGTGGFGSFSTQTFSINSIVGEQDVYFVFTGGSGALLDLDWFRFI